MERKIYCDCRFLTIFVVRVRVLSISIEKYYDEKRNPLIKQYFKAGVTYRGKSGNHLISE